MFVGLSPELCCRIEHGFVIVDAQLRGQGEGEGGHGCRRTKYVGHSAALSLKLCHRTLEGTLLDA